MEKKPVDHWVHDYETLSNLFVAVFEHYKEDVRRVFIVHELQNDFPELLDFLKTSKENRNWHVSFNGLAFDSQITEYILKNDKKLSRLSGDEIARDLYSVAQGVIDKSNNGEFSEFSPWQLSFKQVDLFKLNHWDNPAKKSSLKWIQYSMDWDNILDMPISHRANITTEDEIRTVVTYCINDVRSTKRILQLSKDQVNLRNALSKEYDVDLYSASEPRIAKELFIKFLSEELGADPAELKKLRTFRKEIKVGEILLPYYDFQIPELKNLYEQFLKLKIDPYKTKDAFKYVVNHKNVETTFGLGGLHGACPSGSYVAEPGTVIMSSDVESFYPNLAIQNEWSPAHIPKKVFCSKYKWFFTERKKIPKSDPKNYVYKIILNSTYGLSNDKNSFLYDPMFTMSITINGQLSLLMLYEMLILAIPEAVPLMLNTDGLEMKIPENKKDVYLKVCAEWEQKTRLVLEHAEYEKLYLADVNNYIAVFKDKNKKPKCKGRFEFEGLALHKNKSFLIIPKAIYAFLIHNIPPEETLRTNRNIFDYCAGIKVKSDWAVFETCVVDGEVQYTKQQHTIRYFVSKRGCKLVKKHRSDNREIQIESGKWLQTVFNKVEEKEWSNYQIDEKYYLNAIYRELYKFSEKTNKDLKLF